jgi:hypothetical protein
VRDNVLRAMRPPLMRSVWSPASGPVHWTDEKITAASVQIDRVLVAQILALERAGYRILSAGDVPQLVNNVYRARETGLLIKDAYQAAFDAAPLYGEVGE